MNLIGSQDRQQRTMQLTMQKSMQQIRSTDTTWTLFFPQRNLKMKLKLPQLTVALVVMTISSCFYLLF